MEYNDFALSGFVSDKLPDDLFLELRKECDNARIPHNKRLVGNIEKEYSLTSIKEKEVGKKLLNHLYHMIRWYEDRYGVPSIRVASKDMPIGFSDVWCNYQKKYEFNPLHSHTGIWSFVIWMQIPYDLQEELKNPSCINSAGNCPSIFQFIYEHICGNKVEQLYIDKSHEGTIILFPASLRHCVHPFYTSDDYRISIAGNLCFQVP